MFWKDELKKEINDMENETDHLKVKSDWTHSIRVTRYRVMASVVNVTSMKHSMMIFQIFWSFGFRISRKSLNIIFRVLLEVSVSWAHANKNVVITVIAWEIFSPNIFTLEAIDSEIQ